MLATLQTQLPKQVTRNAGEGMLVASARRGEVDSFNQLVRAYQSIAYRTAYRMLGNPDAAADATQQAFISAYQHLGAHNGTSFKAWLLRIVVNACYDQLRDKQRQRSSSLEAMLGDSDGSLIELSHNSPESPQDAAERVELDGLIQQGLQTLPAEQRMTLVLADIEEFGYEEVAEIMHTNLGTVKSRLSRARAALREFLLANKDYLPRTYRQ